MTNLHDALKFLSLPNACPLSVVALNPDTGRPIAVNSTFESIFGPHYKFKEWDFADAASQDSAPTIDSNGIAQDEVKAADLNRSRFREAIGKVRQSLNTADVSDDVMDSAEPINKIRNVEMLTLGNEAGLPIRKYFDWNIGSVQLDDADDGNAPSSVVILYGDMVNEVESSNR